MKGAVLALLLVTIDATDVVCQTSAGDFTIEVYPDWSPIGVERFLKLVNSRFFDENLIYRTIPNYIVQFGFPALPGEGLVW